MQARVVAFFTGRINDPRACQLLPGMLHELLKTSPTVICPQGLQDVPSFSWLQVCDVPEHLRGVSTAAQAELGTSPFIYTPIRVNDAISRVKQWVAGELSSVKVGISNPFSFKLTVETLCLHVEGVLFEGYPSSPIVLMPNSEMVEVVLQGKAMQPGTLKILGCTCRTFNVDSFHPLKVDPLTVIPPLPLLRIRSFPTWSETDTALTVLHGETQNISYRLQNIGPVPIHKVVVTICRVGESTPFAKFSCDSDYAPANLKQEDEDEEKDEKERDKEAQELAWLAVDTVMLASLVPIPPRASKELVFKVCAQHFRNEPQKFLIAFNYTGGKENSEVLAVPRPLQPPALIRARQQSDSPAPPNTPTENNNDVFSRTLSVNLTVNIQPSLRIHTLEISPLTDVGCCCTAHRGQHDHGGHHTACAGAEAVAPVADGFSHCLLKFQVDNLTQEALNIRILGTTERTGLIHTRCCERFHIPLRRLGLKTTSKINAMAEADAVKEVRRMLEEACVIQWSSSRLRTLP